MKIKRFYKKIVSVFAFSACFFLLTAQCNAGRGCEWKDNGWFLECKSSWGGMSTGCIGLKNLKNHKIRVLVNSNDGTNVRKYFSSKRQKKADYKPRLTIHKCEEKQGNKWKHVKCYDMFDRTKDENSGGG